MTSILAGPPTELQWEGIASGIEAEQWTVQVVPFHPRESYPQYKKQHVKNGPYKLEDINELH